MEKKTFYFVLLWFILFFLEANRATANSTNSQVGCIEIEMKALLSFKKGLIDPFGRLSNWVGKDCCQWSGIWCSRQTGHVITLGLSGLTGKIDPSLADLKHLSSLSLNLNNFNGLPIPEFIGSFSKLTYLDLSDASFSGLVPPHLGNLSNLRYLNLNANDKLWVFDLRWITRFSRLRYLNLGDVNLSLVSKTWLQSVGKLQSLEQLHLPHSKLGNLPEYKPNSNFSSLKILNLDNNALNTSIPQWLFNISTLVKLRLMNSGIIGSLPHDGWRNLCNVQSIDLSYNELRGEIEKFFGFLSECGNSSLEELDVWDNQLSGEIPESIGQFKNLRSVFMGENLVSGSIPRSFGSLSLLESFYIPANAMDGTIPYTIGQLSNLELLDLSRNSWKGVISETYFTLLTKLKTFGLSSLRMSLTVNISQEWIPPFNLNYLEISACNLGSNSPSWIKTQSNLSFLILKDNALSGKIPVWLWEMSPHLNSLDLSGNEFEGKVPTPLVFGFGAWVDLHSNNLEGSIPIWKNVRDLNLDDNRFFGPIPLNFCGEMPLLRTLLLSGNFLNGSIPRCISGLKDLMTLDLSNNFFSGNLQIPWEETRLSVIDLSKNNLSGEIPSSMCSSPYLTVLKLFGNRLSGEISLALENCTVLNILDLGENMLSGKIPESIADWLPYLEALGLRGNMFNGGIPEQICSLGFLHILDLGSNNFSGFIPSCIGDLSGLKSPSVYFPNVIYSLVLYEQKMELIMKGREVEQIRILSIVNVINLSGNDLMGEIPKEIADLAYLGSLNLSNNELTGKIPGKIGGLQRLESLDISGNRISGPIPASMTSLTFLNYLNLSNNNLSGPIPTANQFQTFNDPSVYAGNSNLCGSPLPTNCSSSNDGDDGSRARDGEIEEDDDDGWIDMERFYIGMIPGFAVGFWVVCGSLVIKKSWRYAYFGFVNKVKDRVFVWFALKYRA